jgi:uncharacterized protein YjbJ (UPF0337 family)
MSRDRPDHGAAIGQTVFEADALNLGRRHMGNEQQNEGRMEQARGAIKETVGDLTNNERLQREGEYDRAKGNIREGVGDVREEVDRTVDDLQRDR